MVLANNNPHAQTMGNSDEALSATDVRGDIAATLRHWQTIYDSSSDDEDEILWTGNDLDSDEDFVLIPHMRTTTKPSSAARYEEVTREVIQGITSLSFSQPTNGKYSPTTENTDGRNTKSGVKSTRGNKSNHTNNRSVLTKPPAVSVHQVEKSQVKAKRSRNKRGKKERKENAKAKGSNPSNNTETRLSSSPSVESDAEDTKYEDAVFFITSFLHTSAAALHASQRTKLTFLQSLIIELGLMSPNSTLPASLNSATRFLKSHAFLNLRDYLSVRHEGIDKLQQVMFKSKRALVNDLRKNKGRRQLDRTWVKDHGLSVFLVHT